ncbi:MAG: hypothetical protein ACUZ8E_07200 [Candidatus Anammoxibacter sp.]
MTTEKKEVKIVLIPKTIIRYTEAGGKRMLSIIMVDKKGKITKTHEVKDKALPALKKFVNSL